MTPELLKAAGTALYGSRWKSDLAGALGKQYRAIHRWHLGEVPIPDGTAERLIALLGNRGLSIDTAMDGLRATLSPPGETPER